MDKVDQLLREMAAPLPPEVAVPALHAHLQHVLQLAKSLNEPKFLSQVHELMATAATLKAEKPTPASA